MKLLRIGESGKERPALIDRNGMLRDLSKHVDDIDGHVLDQASLARIAQIAEDTLPEIDPIQRIGPCVASVGKFICIGLNYSDHAAESGMAVPEEPEIFTKATSAICGPYDNILMPRNATKLDWEVELAIVIGAPTKYIEPDQAPLHIAGFCVCNDISERQFQLERGSQWDKGKGCDTFGPIGPWLVTADEIKSVTNLDMWLDVNGVRRQSGNTKTMIFDPYTLVSYVSRFMTLLPGDIISTGTPPGVGLGMNPPKYLAVGDQITLGIQGLGHQRQTVSTGP